jgi:hypothetical protein
MTARPFFQKSRRRPVYAAVALMLVMVALLLAAGCIEQPTVGKKLRIPGNGQFTVSPVGTALASTTLYERITQKTIPQPNNSYADYVKMLKDIYNPGEEIKFYLVNDGNSLMACGNAVPTYHVNYLFENGTPFEFIGPGVVQPGISYIRPGESSAVFSFTTTNWMPGLYQIRFDCGGVYREFRIVVK